MLASVWMLVVASGSLVRHASGNGWIHRASATPRAVSFQVDLNQAAWPELAALPELGETLAREIVAGREQYGPWTSLAELATIRGIGNATLDRIAPYVNLPLKTPGTRAVVRQAMTRPAQTIN